MEETDRTAPPRHVTERDRKLQKIADAFLPHVTAVLKGEVEARSSFGPAQGEPGGRVLQITFAHIVERALLLETRMLVEELLLLLAEHASETGRTLYLDELDDAMMPQLSGELHAIFRDCCHRRIAGVAKTREILRRVRASLPAGQRLPEEVMTYLNERGVSVRS